MTPTQEDRQHEMIVYVAPGNTNNLEVALGINWSSDFPEHSRAQCIPFDSSELLVIQRSRTILHWAAFLLLYVDWRTKQLVIQYFVGVKSLLFGQQFTNLISWCGSILPLIYIIFNNSTEPQQKHVQNLEKATDLFQIINKININSLFVENILCLC